jgi:hypothetical protein
MAKKKTENKELKINEPIKKEVVKISIPDTEMVNIVLNGKEYSVTNEMAHILIGAKRAKLA